MNVAAWLESLDLERYEPLFRDNEIDWEVLPKLTSEDLKEIGVLAIGHRQSYREAIALAQEQSAKSWELRAATSLAGLWREMGRRDAARELLAPVYAWFTEGFDAPDLIDAKALLEELT